MKGIVFTGIVPLAVPEGLALVDPDNARMKLNEIGADLEEIERGFVALRDMLSPELGVSLTSLIRPFDIPARGSRIRPISKPNLPRCKATLRAGAGPCRNPATYPQGLCLWHFLNSVGHRFQQKEPGRWYGSSMICTWCGQTHRCEDHKRHLSLREVCPKRPPGS